MTRMMLMTFFGEAALGAEDAHPHESPAVMTWPMILLAVGSVVAGAFLHHRRAARRTSSPRSSGSGRPRMASSAVAGIAHPGAGAGRRGPGLGGVRTGPGPGGGAGAVGLLTVAARKDLYGDAFNEAVFMRPGQWLTRLSVYFDNRAWTAW